MKIIGLGHRKSVGKDTCVPYITEALHQLWRSRGRIVTKYSFATKLKEVCRILYPEIQPDWVYDNDPQRKNDIVKAINKTVRQIWIDIGTPVLRAYDDDIWIRLTMSANPNSDVVIIPDLRFPNEVKAIRERGGLVIRVDNDRIAKTNDVADCALDSFHDWDDVIYNNGSKEELERACQTIVQTHKDYLKV